MSTWGEILQELQNEQTLQRAAGPQPGGVPSFFDIVRKRHIAALAAHTQRNTIVYSTKWTQPGGSPQAISVSAEDLEGFMEVCHGLRGSSLDLILHSPGGSAEATEAIVNFLRSKFDDIRVIIPHAAMSAACMLACAANRIVMGPQSAIGPIDPQFFVQAEAGSQQRMVPAHAILEQFKMAQKQCRDPALLASWLPMLKQYGPALLVQCELATNLSRSLVSKWLSQYMFAGLPKKGVKAGKIAKALATHKNFMSHGRFIARDQARAMGLLIDDLETDLVVQDEVLSIYHAYSHTFNGTPALKLIENHLGKSFIKMEQRIVAMPQGLQIQLPLQPAPPPGP